MQGNFQIGAYIVKKVKEKVEGKAEKARLEYEAACKKSGDGPLGVHEEAELFSAFMESEMYILEVDMLNILSEALAFIIQEEAEMKGSNRMSGPAGDAIWNDEEIAGLSEEELQELADRYIEELWAEVEAEDTNSGGSNEKETI